eukprot:3219106-Rhodomonas_salina.3
MIGPAQTASEDFFVAIFQRIKSASVAGTFSLSSEQRTSNFELVQRKAAMLFALVKRFSAEPLSEERKVKAKG